MDSLQVAIKSYNYFLSTTLTEGVKRFGDRNRISNEMLYSGTNMHISQEGMFDWVKAKLAKIGQRFVILANQLVSKFSKNRAKLEANIELYRQNPHATVELAISPQTFKKLLVTAGICVAAGAAIIAIKNRGEARRRKIMDDGLDKLGKIFDEDLKVASSEHSSGKVYKTSAATASKFAQDMKANLEKQSRNVATLAKDMKTSNVPSDPAAAKAKMSSLAKASSDMAKVANMSNSLAYTSANKSSVEGGAVTKEDIDKVTAELRDYFDKNTGSVDLNLTTEEANIPGAVSLVKEFENKSMKAATDSGLMGLAAALPKAKTKAELKSLRDRIMKQGKTDADHTMKLYREFRQKLAALKSKGPAKDGVTKADIERAFAEIGEILKQHRGGEIAGFHLTPEEEKIPGAVELAKATSAEAVRIVTESGVASLVDQLSAAKTKDELKHIKDQIITYGKSDATALVRLSKTFQRRLAALKH